MLGLMDIWYNNVDVALCLKRERLTNLMSSSLISRVISVLAFCTASSFAPERKQYN